MISIEVKEGGGKMADTMMMKTLHITKEQKNLIENEAKKTDKSEAQIIREAIDKYLKGE